MAHSILDSLYSELSGIEFRWNEIGLEKRRLFEGTVELLYRDFGETSSLHDCRYYLCKEGQLEVLEAIHWHIAKRFADNAAGHESYDLLCKEIKDTAHDPDIGKYIYAYLNGRMFSF